MKNEIKFRGKATMPIVEMGEYGIRHNAGWVYGSYLDGYILSGVAVADTDCFSPEWWCRVDPKTVGQYTRCKDCAGREIYEGMQVCSIVRFYPLRGMSGEVLFGEFRDADYLVACDEDPYMDHDGERRATIGFYVRFENGDCYPLDSATEKWLEVVE